MTDEYFCCVGSLTGVFSHCNSIRIRIINNAPLFAFTATFDFKLSIFPYQNLFVMVSMKSCSPSATSHTFPDPESQMIHRPI